MAGGLNLWQNNNHNILLDADNLFWAIIKQGGLPESNIKNQKDNKFFVSRQILQLYGKTKDKLDKRFHNFRFSKELTAVYIDPTDRCNADCRYCYVPQKLRKNGRSMTQKELRFILEKIARYFQNSKKKPVIVFHASEPLIVKDILFDAISKYSKIFKFGLQTNAVLLEKKDVEFLKKYRVGIGISLDSFRPGINDKLRPMGQSQGNFKQAVKAIEWFDGYSGLNVITTITKFNIQDLPELVKFLHRKKVPCVLLNPLRFTQIPARTLKPNTDILTKYFIQAVETAVNLSERTSHKIIIGNFANVILAIAAPEARRLMCDISPCGGGRCFFTITASGEMIPCGEFIGLKGFSAGNIFKTSIQQTMESESFKRIRGRIVENIAECNLCELRNICGAPCPAELHALGNMHQKSVFCEFYKAIISYAFGIIAQGKEKYCLRTEGLKNLRYEYQIEDNTNKKGRIG